MLGRIFDHYALNVVWVLIAIAIVIWMYGMYLLFCEIV